MPQATGGRLRTHPYFEWPSFGGPARRDCAPDAVVPCAPRCGMCDVMRRVLLMRGVCRGELPLPPRRPRRDRDSGHARPPPAPTRLPPPGASARAPQHGVRMRQWTPGPGPMPRSTPNRGGPAAEETPSARGGGGGVGTLARPSPLQGSRDGDPRRADGGGWGGGVLRYPNIYVSK